MHLFLSPHYDDAVLSCGGLIHRLAQNGERVVVRTVMGGAPSPGKTPDTALVRDLHARWAAGLNPVETRRQEDEAAVGSLGAAVDHLGYWTDCVYRLSRAGEPLYTTEASLFGEVHPDDVAGALLPTMVLPPREVVRVIYAPLGVGNHVDHQIVRNWGLELKQQYSWVALKFYEEYPYLETAGAVERALTFFAMRAPPLKLDAELAPLSEADVTAKIRAVAHYRSQVSTFWVDAAAMETALRAALKRTGGAEPAERLWRVM